MVQDQNLVSHHRATVSDQGNTSEDGQNNTKSEKVTTNNTAIENLEDANENETTEKNTDTL